MAGVYIHIPFCKKRCKYCDFFSTTRLERREEYMHAVMAELIDRQDEIGEAQTLYFGGGTPSTLDAQTIARIIRLVKLAPDAEITMEMNPGDITEPYLHEIRETGVNRLSIGIQSFQNQLLELLGRRHNAIQAIDAVHLAQRTGFGNISIDLMYAIPTQMMTPWIADIELALRLGIQHISAYGLMYEQGTQLTRMRDAGEIEAIDEEEENKMYDRLCKRLKKSGFIHYEVSNFALPGYESKHNSSYWNGTPYAGIGAGAHSYNGYIRSWNPDNLDAYIKGIRNHKLKRKSEALSDTDRYNERIMLGLRTLYGIRETEITTAHDALESYIAQHMLKRTEDGRIIATQNGIHILNRIIEDLMI